MTFFVLLKHQKLNCVFVLPMKNHCGQPRSALCHTCSVFVHLTGTIGPTREVLFF